MANKTIKESIRDLFLGLGGDAKALADNSDTSDYIDDLESAIKAGALPDVSDVETDGVVLAVIGGKWTLCTVEADTTTGDITFTPVESDT